VPDIEVHFELPIEIGCENYWNEKLRSPEQFEEFSKRSFSRPSPAYPKIINLPFVLGLEMWF
jgi:hypothetical protein